MGGLRRSGADWNTRGAARWRCGPKGFWGGAIESLGWAVLFPVVGLAWTGLALPASDPEPHYPGAVVELNPAEAPRIWLVDGYNVVQVGLLGGRSREQWWREPAREELLIRATSFEGRADELWVVFDGPRAEGPGIAGGRLHPIFAPSADEWLVARVVAEPDPRRVSVVTADRRLAARVRRRGASVVSPAEFLRRCGEHRHGPNRGTFPTASIETRPLSPVRPVQVAMPPDFLLDLSPSA